MKSQSAAAPGSRPSRVMDILIELHAAARKAVDFRGATCHDDPEIEELRALLYRIELKLPALNQRTAEPGAAAETTTTSPTKRVKEK